MGVFMRKQQEDFDDLDFDDLDEEDEDYEDFENDDDTDEDEDDTELYCPYGYIFGKDYNIYPECETCKDEIANLCMLGFPYM